MNTRAVKGLLTDKGSQHDKIVSGIGFGGWLALFRGIGDGMCRTLSSDTLSVQHAIC